MPTTNLAASATAHRRQPASAPAGSQPISRTATEHNAEAAAAALPGPPAGGRLAIEIVEFTTQHVLASAALMARSFATLDPLTRAAGISAEEMYPYALDIAEKAARDGISLAALDPSGRVLGCLVCEGCDDFIVPTRPLSPKFDAVFALFDRLHHPFLTHERHLHPPGSIVHCTDIAVALDVVGRGVAAQLNLANLLGLHARGFRWAYGEFSNDQNYRSMGSWERRVLAKVDLATFEHAGARPFAAANGFAISAIAPLPDPDQVRAEFARRRLQAAAATGHAITGTAPSAANQEHSHGDV